MSAVIHKQMIVNSTLYTFDDGGKLINRETVIDSPEGCHVSVNNKIVGASKDCKHVERKESGWEEEA